jgi:hypothetical protein
MALSKAVVTEVRAACSNAGAQARVEKMLARYNFIHLPTEGCWVLPSKSVRIFVHGRNWVMIGPPSNSGADTEVLQKELERLCE